MEINETIRKCIFEEWGSINPSYTDYRGFEKFVEEKNMAIEEAMNKEKEVQRLTKLLKTWGLNKVGIVDGYLYGMDEANVSMFITAPSPLIYASANDLDIWYHDFSNITKDGWHKKPARVEMEYATLKNFLEFAGKIKKDCIEVRIKDGRVFLSTDDDIPPKLSIEDDNLEDGDGEKSVLLSGGILKDIIAFGEPVLSIEEKKPIRIDIASLRISQHEAMGIDFTFYLAPRIKDE